MDVRGRALYLTLASSGMRIGETLKVKVADLEMDKEPVRIMVRGEHTKNGDSRIAFVSTEAKEALAEWLRRREHWLE